MNISKNKEFYLSLAVLLLLMTGLLSALVLVQRRQAYEKRAAEQVGQLQNLREETWPQVIESMEEGRVVSVLARGRNHVTIGAISGVPGTTGSFSINLSNQDEVGGVQVGFEYDASIGLEITGVRKAGQGESFSLDFNQRDEEPPSLKKLIILLYDPALPWTVIGSGEGGILEVDYRVLAGAAGETDLDIGQVYLSRAGAPQPLEATWEDGHFAVITPSPTPIFRPTPTLGPTATPVPTIPAGRRRVFVTADDLPGVDKLGGLAGADGLCQSRAEAAGLGGEWAAWLSTTTMNAKDRLVDTAYYLVDRVTLVANSKADFLDGSLRHEINMDEKGNWYTEEVGSAVWTGTNQSGMGSGNNCRDWTDRLASGTYGSHYYKDHQWTVSDEGPMMCITSLRLYCFEMPKATPTPTLEPTPTLPSGKFCASGYLKWVDGTPISGIAGELTVLNQSECPAPSSEESVPLRTGENGYWEGCLPTFSDLRCDPMYVWLWTDTKLDYYAIDRLESGCAYKTEIGYSEPGQKEFPLFWFHLLKSDCSGNNTFVRPLVTPTPTPAGNRPPFIFPRKDSLPDGYLGQTYKPTFVLGLDIDRDVVTLTVSQASLPPGLRTWCYSKPSGALALCMLFGKPLVAGDYTVTVGAVDEWGGTATQTYTLVVHP